MRGQKGITLVALIITIIVMLILVAVAITVVIQSGLLDTASEAGKKTQQAVQNESTMNDTVTINGNEGSIGDHVNNIVNGTALPSGD